MEVQNILVPIDFSKCSKNALKVAIAIAQKTQAKIHMVNAVQVHTPHPDLTGGSLLDSIIADYEDQVRHSYNELQKEMEELKNVPYEADKFLAYFSDAVLTAIESKSIDLVVMGTRADHGKLDHLVGTHATDVIAGSKVPVLVIPENITEFNPAKIGFATDLLKLQGTRVDLSPLKWLADLNKGEVFTFHISENPEKMTTEEQKQIKIIASALEGKSSIRTVQSDSLTDGINDFIKNHDLNVIAMIPRRHNFFKKVFTKSVSRSISIDPIVPVFAFHND